MSAELRALAEKAGKTWPGQNWPDARALDRDGTGVGFKDSKARFGRLDGTQVLNRYIAALDPQTVLRLLDERDAAIRRAEEAEARVAELEMGRDTPGDEGKDRTQWKEPTTAVRRPDTTTTHSRESGAARRSKGSTARTSEPSTTTSNRRGFTASGAAGSATSRRSESGRRGCFGGLADPPDPEPIANETESGYARRRELVAEARAALRSQESQKP